MGSTAWGGVWAGWALFLALAGIAYLTPARLHVSKIAGRDHTALILQLEASQQAEPGTALSEAGSVRSRLAAWRRLHSGLSPFGLAAWVLDLWPWLLGFGLAFPALGGLIGAQVPRQKAKGKSLPRAESRGQKGEQAAERVDGPGKAPEDAVSAVQVGDSQEYDLLHPARDTVPEDTRISNPPQEKVPEGSRTDLPAPSAWNWAARGVVRPDAGRPRPPPVQSPHGPDAGDRR